MIALDEPANGTIWCECGQRKRGGNLACKRCTYLDGLMPAAQLAIDAMRGSGALSLRELCMAVYGKHTDSNGGGMLRLMQRLMRHGRVRRFEREIEQCETMRVVVRDREGRRRGSRSPLPGEVGERALHGGGIAWVYTLTERVR